MLETTERNDFQILHLRGRLGPAVRLHDAGDDVVAAGTEGLGLEQQLVGLADARRGADVDPQPRPGRRRLLDARQQGVRARSRLSHRLSTYANPTATRKTSMTLMPTKGRSTPPAP